MDAFYGEVYGAQNGLAEARVLARLNQYSLYGEYWGQAWGCWGHFLRLQLFSGLWGLLVAPVLFVWNFFAV